MKPLRVLRKVTPFSLVSIAAVFASLAYIVRLASSTEPRHDWPRAGERPKAELLGGQLCVARHASMHCYGGADEPWSMLVDDAARGFR